MKDLSKFPQLPVTSYTLSSLYLATMCFHVIYYSLASSNVRLTTVPTVPSYLTALALVCHHHVSLSGFKEWKIYQSSHSYQLPSHPFIPRLCVPSSSIAILLGGMKHLLQFPQLPVAYPPLPLCAPSSIVLLSCQTLEIMITKLLSYKVTKSSF